VLRVQGERLGRALRKAAIGRDAAAWERTLDELCGPAAANAARGMLLPAARAARLAAGEPADAAGPALERQIGGELAELRQRLVRLWAANEPGDVPAKLDELLAEREAHRAGELAAEWVADVQR
jgi:hypothetical protein